MTVKAIYENGVFKPKEALKEHTEVQVFIPMVARSSADDPTGDLKRMTLYHGSPRACINGRWATQLSVNGLRGRPFAGRWFQADVSLPRVRRGSESPSRGLGAS